MDRFFAWLSAQSLRPDPIGAYAQRARRNTRFPRSSRLYVLLKYEAPAWREDLKRAHREWRKARRRVAR